MTMSDLAWQCQTCGDILVLKMMQLDMETRELQGRPTWGKEHGEHADFFDRIKV
jgi:hypothetical protein